MKIKLASEADLPEVVRLSIEGIGEFDFKAANMPVPDPQQIAMYVYKEWLTAPVFLLQKDGNNIGFWGLKLDSHWWAKEVYLTDYRFYITPCHRDINAVKLLYTAGKDFAAAHGLPLHCQMLATDGRLDARRRLMRRLGFKETGFVFASKG